MRPYAWIIRNLVRAVARNTSFKPDIKIIRRYSDHKDLHIGWITGERLTLLSARTLVRSTGGMGFSSGIERWGFISLCSLPATEFNVRSRPQPASSSREWHFHKSAPEQIDSGSVEVTVGSSYGECKRLVLRAIESDLRSNMAEPQPVS